MAIYNTYFSVLGLQDSLGVLPNLGVLPGLGRLDDLGEYAFSPTSLFLNGEQGVWYDPSDLTPEKVSWRRNLLTYSQDFENAAWTKSNASILSNLLLYSQEFGTSPWVLGGTATVTSNTTTAPDGTTTADTLSFPASSNTIYQQSAATLAGVTYTMSVWLRADSPGTIRIAFANDGTKGVDVSVTTSWTRFTYTNTTAAGNDGMQIRRDSAGQLSAVYAWGAQLVPGSTAQTYTRSLATAAPIQFADPLGGTLADKLVENTATSTHRILQSPNGPTGVAYTASVYAKSAERTYLYVEMSDSATGSIAVTVNLSTGVAGAIGTSGAWTNTSVATTAIADGWYRVAFTATRNAGTSTTATFGSSLVGSPSYTGDGVSGIYVYGAQVEQASTASAYQRITDFSSDFLAAFPTHALYQTFEGITPVTALGQSVGLVMDKRLGGLTNVGPEQVVNGNFSSATGWTLDSGASIADGVLTFNSVGSTFGAQQGYTNIPQNAICQVVVVVTAVSAGQFRVKVNAGNYVLIPAYAGTHTLFVVAGSSTAVGIELKAAGTTSGVIDSISLRQVPGNHAIQATSAARPTLQARSNLFTYSEQIDNAVWTKSSATISANTTVAPDGTTTADTLTASAGTGLLPRFTDVSTVTVNGSVYSASVFARAGTYSFVQIYLNNQGSEWANYTLTGNGTATANGSCTATISNVGSGWYRLTMTYTAGGTDRRPFFMLAASATATRAEAWNPVGTETAVFWGAQFELGSTATTYQRVTTATDYADVGLPRNLTFDGVDDSLATAGNVDFATWTVGTRRNLLVNPTQLSASGWTFTNASGTATLVGNTLTMGASALDRVIQGVSVSAGAYTASFTLSGSGDVRLFIFDGNGSTLTSLPVTLTATPTLYTFTRTVTTSGINGGLGIFNNSAGTAGAVVNFVNAQLEVGSTATAFQDVGTDKVTLFSGLFKASDAAYGSVAELSVDWFSNNGAFQLAAPQSPGASFSFISKGTVTQGAGNSTLLYPAPITAVVTGIGNIGSPLVARRVNQAEVTNTSNQGTGNYGSYLLYVGRRGSTSLPFNGRLFQLVIRGAATDSVTVGNAERWVGQLTGVAL